MTRQVLEIVQGGAALPLFLAFEVNGERVDLTSATSPKFYMRPRDGGARKIDGATAVIANGSYNIAGDGVGTVTLAPTDGVVIYDWTAANLDTVGWFDTTAEVTLGAKLLLVNGPAVHIVAGA